MNNYEWLRALSLDDLAHKLCELSECGTCPVSEDCRPLKGGNGFKRWLNKESEETDNVQN